MSGSIALSLQTDIERIIDVEGTPALIIRREIIERNYKQFCDQFKNVKIYYALKANPHPGIIEILRTIGCDPEISSLGELEQLVNLGFPAERIISSNPVKDQFFIKAAYDSGINLFAFDSYAEIQKLVKNAPGSRVYVRLSVSNEGSEWPLSRKFGVEEDEAVDLLWNAKEVGLEPCGIAFHVGSQCTRPQTWVEAIEKSRRVWDKVGSKGIDLSVLNIGGGFPIEYIRPVPSLAEIADPVNEALSQLFSKFQLFFDTLPPPTPPGGWRIVGIDRSRSEESAQKFSPKNFQSGPSCGHNIELWSKLPPPPASFPAPYDASAGGSHINVV